jgi:hypothetical protein
MEEDIMRVLMIDFDGTITKENLFPNIGAPRPRVFDAIRTLQERGWICCLWTCRTGDTLEAAKRFIEENGVKMDYYNAGPYDEKSYSGRKAIADVYIDDSAYPVKMFQNEILDWERIVIDLTGMPIS